MWRWIVAAVGAVLCIACGGKSRSSGAATGSTGGTTAVQSSNSSNDPTSTSSTSSAMGTGTTGGATTSCGGLGGSSNDFVGVGVGGSSGTTGLGGAGNGGAAGAGDDVGFYCPTGSADSSELCTPGEQCVNCIRGDDYRYRCVPSQHRNPEGFAAAVADCDSTFAWMECDGPEDCFDGEYCVNDGPNRCSDVPLFGNCCLTCDALPLCTLCRSDEDCGGGTCGAETGASAKGCFPRPCDSNEECQLGFVCELLRCVPGP